MEQQKQSTKCSGGAEKMRERKKAALQESASTNISDLFGGPSHSSGSGISTRHERSADMVYSSLTETVAEDDPDEPIESQRDQSLDFEMRKGEELPEEHLQE